MADTLLKCTTRHVRLFTARVDNQDLVPSADELTLDLDPDNEFLWSDAVVSKVQQRFQQLVDAGAGGELSDYSLRRIGTDLEGYIRQLLQALDRWAPALQTRAPLHQLPPPCPAACLRSAKTSQQSPL